MSDTAARSLSDLDYVPYLDDRGLIPAQFAGQVGAYAIFDDAKHLQFIGYSRDIALSLKQHLVRQPDRCYWVKVQPIDRPSRTVLEGIRDQWIAENGELPAGNAADEPLWNQPIDAKVHMTDEEKLRFKAGDDRDRVKLLKQVARRVEEGIVARLGDRGVQEAIRFDPKLKEEGLLNLK